MHISRPTRAVPHAETVHSIFIKKVSYPWFLRPDELWIVEFNSEWNLELGAPLNPSWQPCAWRTRIKLVATLQTNGGIITKFLHFIALYLYMIWHLFYPNPGTPTSPLVNRSRWSWTTPAFFKLAGADPLFDILKVIFHPHWHFGRQGLHRLTLLVWDPHLRLLSHLPHLSPTTFWPANLQLLVWRFFFDSNL